MKKKQTREDKLIELVEELQEKTDCISMTAYERDSFDFTFCELRDVLENGI